MSASTNTTPGTIVLAGDLTGSATAPVLIPTGVIAGTALVKKMWVDSKGRILKISPLTTDNVLDSIDTASDAHVGIVKVATGNWKGLITSTSGTINAPIASASVFGQVKGDGTTVMVTDGVMNLNLPLATDTVSGLVKVGTGFESGTIQVPAITQVATTSVKGYFKPGTGLQIDSTGLSVQDSASGVKGIASVAVANGLSVSGGYISYTPGSPAVATDTTAGFVKVPTANGLSIDGTGAVSVNTATASLGVIKTTDGNGLLNTAGVLAFTLPAATISTRGFVQVGAGIDNSSGTISIPIAGTSTLGVARVLTSNGLSVTGGVVNMALANGTGTYGTVKSANASNIAITAGAINVGANIAQLNTANTFTSAQNSTLYTNAAATGSLSYNPANGDNQMWTLTGNLTLTGFSSGVNGGIYTLILKQDGTGSRTLTISTSNIKLQNGIALVLTSDPNAYDMITFIYVSSTQILAIFTPDWT